MLTRYSKVTRIEAATGAMKWQRSAIGQIEKAFVRQRAGVPFVALAIKSTDVKKTRIAEYILLFVMDA